MDSNERELFRRAATRLQVLRGAQPSMTSFLCSRRGMAGPLYFGLGVLALLAYGYLPLDALGWPIALCGGMAIGAGARELGAACDAVQYWPAHRELIDWQRAEQFSQSGES